MVSDIKTAIVNHIKDHEGIPNPSTKQIIAFLNTNKDKMTCGNEKKNYMMAAFDNGAHNQLFKSFFMTELAMKKQKPYINLNAVSFNGPNGAPITVLDYIDSVLADKTNSPGFLKEVRGLRNMFTKHLKAKTFSELPQAEQRRYLKAKQK